MFWRIIPENLFDYHQANVCFVLFSNTYNLIALFLLTWIRMLDKAVALLIRIRIILSCSAPLAQLDRAPPF